MPHKLEKLVVDALGACQELRQFTSGKTLDDVLLDRGLQLVIERLFEILGVRPCIAFGIWMSRFSTR